MTIFDRHQLRIARETLRLTDIGARVMGGPTKAEARAIIARLAPRNRTEDHDLRVANRIDGYDRDDLGASPDY